MANLTTGITFGFFRLLRGFSVEKRILEQSEVGVFVNELT